MTGKWGVRLVCVTFRLSKPLHSRPLNHLWSLISQGQTRGLGGVLEHAGAHTQETRLQSPAGGSAVCCSDKAGATGGSHRQELRTEGRSRLSQSREPPVNGERNETQGVTPRASRRPPGKGLGLAGAPVGTEPRSTCATSAGHGGPRRLCHHSLRTGGRRLGSRPRLSQRPFRTLRDEAEKSFPM